MHSLTRIIENQVEFREEIISYLNNDMSEAMRILRGISTDDQRVTAKTESFRKKVKKMKIPSPRSLFVSQEQWNHKFYAWWDELNEEAIIYRYEQQTQ